MVKTAPTSPAEITLNSCLLKPLIGGKEKPAEAGLKWLSI
jgi:hypothetical protein